MKNDWIHRTQGVSNQIGSDDSLPGFSVAADDSFNGYCCQVQGQLDIILNEVNIKNGYMLIKFLSQNTTNTELLMGLRVNKNTGDGLYAGLKALYNGTNIKIYKRESDVMTQLATSNISGWSHTANTIFYMKFSVVNNTKTLQFLDSGLSVLQTLTESTDSTFTTSGSVGIYRYAPANFLSSSGGLAFTIEEINNA